ncbi:MAG: ImmA/IrrE family metallo-endopeptidase [Pseudomonadota bacterium]
MLDPAIAAKVLGIDFRYVDGIGRHREGGQLFEVAGMIDRRSGTISVSRVFRAVRFTAAHELGHWILHPHHTLLRDRPVARFRRERSSRRPEEAEADHFAACFLMPRNLVTTYFEAMYSIEAPFVFDDASAFQLRPDNPDSLLRRIDELDRAVALATARSYNGKPLRPLHEVFRVSIDAMAYRLMELNLVDNGGRVAVDAPPVNGHDKPFAPLFPEGLHLISEESLLNLFVWSFPSNGRRLELANSLKDFLDFLKGIRVNCDIWLDGSFTTNKPEPDDIDLVVFIHPGQIDALPHAQHAKLTLLNDKALMRELYDCDVYVDPADKPERQRYWIEKFGQGRGNKWTKGIPVLRITHG